MKVLDVEFYAQGTLVCNLTAAPEAENVVV